MSRRALRKIDPRLDLANYLKTPAELPDAWTSAALFHNKAPLEVEVGCGKGMFLAAVSQAQRRRNFLGIEVAARYARFAAAKLARVGCKNAMMIHGNAVELIHDRIPDSSVQAVHVYFPDPWWKKRHKKRRIMNAQFLVDVQRVLAVDGRLHFWTDVKEYFESSLNLIAQFTTFQGLTGTPELSSTYDAEFRTHFERRTRLNNLKVYRSEYRKHGVELVV